MQDITVGDMVLFVREKKGKVYGVGTVQNVTGQIVSVIPFGGGMVIHVYRRKCVRLVQLECIQESCM